MNEHVTAWIAAYHDAELSGDQRQKVAAHLHNCAQCQAELEALQRLSARLQEAPASPARLSPDRFVSQVRLRIGAQSKPEAGKRWLKTGWRLIPAGVIGLWAFGQAVLLTSGWLTTLLPVLDSSASSGWQAAQGLGLLLAIDLGLTFLTVSMLAGWLASWWATLKQPK